MSNNKDLVSIVLPVYNGEKYLALSIESIIAQTYDNWELIIIDDCSTDDSASIAKEYSKKDNRIHYYMNDINLKLPRSLNKGFSIAKGDYLTWTSDDNLYLPEALCKMVNVIKKKNIDFVFATCDVINDEGQVVEIIRAPKEYMQSIVGVNCVGACFLYTRNVYEKVGEYNPEYFLVEDYDYWLRIFSRFDVFNIQETLYQYRRHDKALTSTMKKEVFYNTLEKLLLNDIVLFSKLSNLQKYYFYKTLYNCRKNLGDKVNPYNIKYKLYSKYYLIFYIIPNKFMRLFSAK